MLPNKFVRIYLQFDIDSGGVGCLMKNSLELVNFLRPIIILHYITIFIGLKLKKISWLNNFAKFFFHLLISFMLNINKY